MEENAHGMKLNKLMMYKVGRWVINGRIRVRITVGYDQYLRE